MHPSPASPDSLSARVGATFAALTRQRDEAADGWERAQQMTAQALAAVQAVRRDNEALLEACHSALLHLEGQGHVDPLDELRTVEAVIAMLRDAIGEARAG